MDKCSKVGALYVATLKGMALVHQHSHWTTKGSNFYAEHQLFERIYDSALKDLDLAAEKFIGIFGDDVLAYDLQIELLTKVLARYSKFEGSPAEMSLAIEKDFIKFSVDAYECFDEAGVFKKFLGLDDMVMAISSSREESVYLLQQTLKGKS